MEAGAASAKESRECHYYSFVFRAEGEEGWNCKTTSDHSRSFVIPRLTLTICCVWGSDHTHTNTNADMGCAQRYFYNVGMSGTACPRNLYGTQYTWRGGISLHNQGMPTDLPIQKQIFVFTKNGFHDLFTIYIGIQVSQRDPGFAKLLS